MPKWAKSLDGPECICTQRDVVVFVVFLLPGFYSGFRRQIGTNSPVKQPKSGSV